MTELENIEGRLLAIEANVTSLQAAPPDSATSESLTVGPDIQGTYNYSHKYKRLFDIFNMNIDGSNNYVQGKFWIRCGAYDAVYDDDWQQVDTGDGFTQNGVSTDWYVDTAVTTPKWIYLLIEIGTTTLKIAAPSTMENELASDTKKVCPLWYLGVTSGNLDPSLIEDHRHVKQWGPASVSSVYRIYDYVINYSTGESCGHPHMYDEIDFPHYALDFTDNVDGPGDPTGQNSDHDARYWRHYDAGNQETKSFETTGTLHIYNTTAFGDGAGAVIVDGGMYIGKGLHVQNSSVGTDISDGFYSLNGDAGIRIDSGQVITIGANQVVADRGATISDPTGGATVDSEARTAINAIIDRLQSHGLIS